MPESILEGGGIFAIVLFSAYGLSLLRRQFRCGRHFSVDTHARKNILELTPYRCARDDYSSGILLDANENSFGPSVDSYPALELNRYPDPLHMELKQLIGAYRTVTADQIFLGVGSDEAIDILIRIFCEPRVDNIVITPPTYGMYKVCAKVHDVSVRTALLTPEFDVDMANLDEAINSNSKLLFLCSPGNPTAKSISLDVVEKVANMFHGLVVVDEAYIDFSSVRSACSLIQTHSNIIVLQTMSKAFGLAGVRLGLAIGRPDVIQLMNNVKAPYNVNKLTAQVAMEALSSGGLELFEKHRTEILNARRHLIEELKGIAFVQKIYHTDANFILFRLPQAQLVYKRLADRGVVTRYRGSEPLCAGCIRVSVGTPEQNDTFIHMLKQLGHELGLA